MRHAPNRLLTHRARTQGIHRTVSILTLTVKGHESVLSKINLLVLESERSDLGQKWVRLDHIGTNPGIFRSDTEPKCTESDLSQNVLNMI